jgi:hypothetical protein
MPAPYAAAPGALIDTYDNPITNTAAPYVKQLDGGVNATSISGQLNNLTQTRPARCVIRTVDYPVVRDFLVNLKGKPFAWMGTNWLILDKSWTPVGWGVYELNMTLTRVYG